MRKRLLLPAAVLLAIGCTESPTVPLDGMTDESAIRPASRPPGAMPVISDARTDGNPEFYFLWPIVSERVPRDRPFDPDARPSVTICRMDGDRCGATVAEFPYSDGPGLALRTTKQRAAFEFYNATWLTPRDGRGRYRAVVKAYGLELGFVDVQPVRSAFDLRSIPSGVAGVIAGWPLPIPFRIDVAAANPPPAPTCTACVFKTQVFVRKAGSPASEVVTFPAVPVADHMIEITDGGSPGTNGSVLVNGVAILSERGSSDTGLRVPPSGGPKLG